LSLVRGSGERNGAQRRTQVSFGKTMIQALNIAVAVEKKRHISGQSDVEKCKKSSPEP